MARLITSAREPAHERAIEQFNRFAASQPDLVLRELDREYFLYSSLANENTPGYQRMSIQEFANYTEGLHPNESAVLKQRLRDDYDTMCERVGGDFLEEYQDTESR